MKLFKKKKIKFNILTKHFAVLYGSDDKYYYYSTITHNNNYKKYGCIELLKNPNLKDNKKSYLINKIERKKKKTFRNTAKHLNLSILDNELIDLKILEPYIERQKAREEKENKLQQETENKTATKNKENKDKEDAKEIEKER